MLPWHTNIILNSFFPYSKAVISHVLPQYANSITITNKADYSHFGKILQIVASHRRNQKDFYDREKEKKIQEKKDVVP